METPHRELKQPSAAGSPPVTDEAEDPGKLTRISLQTKGLVEDVKSWVDLKLTLTQMEVEDKIDARVNRVVVGAVVGALGLLGLSFALVAASLGLGALAGHDAWGFLIVAGILILVTLLLLVIKPRIVNVTSRDGRSRKSDG